MALAAADVIIFGIQAGIRLYGQARQVYIERTRERELVLPLPGLDHEPTASRARLYFSRNPQGRLHVVESLRLRELHLKAEQNLNTFRSEDPEGLAEYVELFVIYRAIDAGGDAARPGGERQAHSGLTPFIDRNPCLSSAGSAAAVGNSDRAFPGGPGQDQAHRRLHAGEPLAEGGIGYGYRGDHHHGTEDR